MKKQTKFILIVLIGISCFTVLIIINFSLYKKPQALTTVENISLIVDYNNGTIKEHYNFTLDGGKTTALDALERWCDIEYQEFSWGIIVLVIDKVGGDWIYMVNGNSPGVSAAFYPLNDGDIVKWLRVG
jgi:hypothetical protein